MVETDKARKGGGLRRLALAVVMLVVAISTLALIAVLPESVVEKSYWASLVALLFLFSIIYINRNHGGAVLGRRKRKEKSTFSINFSRPPAKRKFEPGRRVVRWPEPVYYGSEAESKRKPKSKPERKSKHKLKSRLKQPVQAKAKVKAPKPASKQKRDLKRNRNHKPKKRGPVPKPKRGKRVQKE